MKGGWRVLLRHAGRNLRHGGLPLVFALLMTALGVLGLGAFLTVSFNVDRVLARVSDSVGVVAFLDVKEATDADGVAAKLRALPSVESVKLVSPSAADMRVRRALEHDPTLLEEARGVSVGWAAELTPRYSRGFDGDSVARAAAAVERVDDVMYPGGEIKRVESFLFLVRTAGGFLAGLIAMIVMLVIHNVVKLTLYARREEIGIMKLVGATDFFVRAPFLVVGLVEGIAGAALGIIALYALHATFARIVGEALKSVFGNLRIDALPPSWALGLLLCSALLGVIGALFSVRRFLHV